MKTENIFKVTWSTSGRCHTRVFDTFQDAVTFANRIFSESLTSLSIKMQ